MNIKKIVSLLLFILITMCVTITYAASPPPANADATKIKKYVDNNDISTVSISTLLGWYQKVGEDTVTVSKVDRALKNKTDGEISGYVGNKSVDYLKKNVSSGILSTWADTVSNTSIKNTLKQASDELNKERQEAIEETNLNSKIIDPSSFDPSSSQPESSEKSTELGNKLVGIVQAIGSLVSVGALAVIGIRYMLGSSEEKAEYKSTMIPYIVGAILTFCACHIVSAIYNVMT